MDNIDFNNFANKSYNNHKDKIIKKHIELASSDIKDLDSTNDNNISSNLGIYIGHAISASIELSINILSDYHNWLLENYDINPKKK